MAGHDQSEGHEGHERHAVHDGNGATYRVAGSLTITRAATTQRELDALPDPLTIDLSHIDRMDTVGAWIVYRTVRDRKAKVIGASRDEVSLLKQVGDFDHPVKIVPEQSAGFFRVLTELGEWVAETGEAKIFFTTSMPSTTWPKTAKPSGSPPGAPASNPGVSDSKMKKSA